MSAHIRQIQSQSLERQPLVISGLSVAGAGIRKQHRLPCGGGARSGVRSGFTLLEVLCAVVLSTLLLASIYTSMSTYYRFSTASRKEVEREQIARSVLRRISNDLRCAYYESKTTTGTSTSGQTGSGVGGTTSPTGSTSAPTSNSGGTTQVSSSAPASWPSGLTGTATELQVHISRPPAPSNSAAVTPSTAVAGAGSDASVVTWSIGSPGSQSGAVPTAGGNAGSSSNTGSGSIGNSTSGSDSTLDGTTGLMRAESSRVIAQMQGNYAERVEILAAEIISIRFRYFDGTEYQDSWDSAETEGLPTAVEIQLEVSSDAGRSAQLATGSIAAAGAGATSTSTTVRYVVAIPTAEPLETAP